MSEIILTISGMSCGGCVNSINRVLQASPGVQKAEVTLVPPQAAVHYDPAVTNPEMLAKLVSEAGFAVIESRHPAA